MPSWEAETELKCPEKGMSLSGMLVSKEGLLVNGDKKLTSHMT